MQRYFFVSLSTLSSERKNDSNTVVLQGRGGVLTEQEEKEIRETVAMEKAIGTPYVKSEFFVGDPTVLSSGRPVDAVLGLESRMNVSSLGFHEYHQRLSKEVEGIRDEVMQHLENTHKSVEICDMLRFVLDAEGSDHVNKGMQSAQLSDLLLHSDAKAANLTLAQLAALRLYTTKVYQHMNDPLRDSARYCQGNPCPLAATTWFASEGIKKLRALSVDLQNDRVLWRGMRNFKVTDDFMQMGGTELGFMSATTQLKLAVRYALNKHKQDQDLLLFKIRVPDFMSAGANLAWLSAFPQEEEVLYPPLTFLKPTGRVGHMDFQSDGRQIRITVIEVVPHIS